MQRVAGFLWANPIAGLRSRPGADRQNSALFVLYGLFALVVGLGSGLLDPSLPRWWEVLAIPPLLVLYPCLVEEFVFRGVLLPRSLQLASRQRQFAHVAGSTAVFVAMHPLNHWLVGLSDTSDFTDPWFLVIVTALGVTCAVQYLRSGSLWWPIATHWATVVAWNLFLGRDLAA